MNAMERLAEAIAADGIGRPFFCAITLHAPGTADAGALLRLAESVLGAATATESRQVARSQVLQTLHAHGGISQIILREGAEAATLELDGEAGSLRLGADGALQRHIKKT